MAKLTVGADPEFFVKRNGHWISAHHFKCGTKREPMKTEHGSIQVDGMALEVNVKPATTSKEFVYNTHGVITDLRNFLKREDKSCEIFPEPSVVFTKNVWDYVPEEAKRLGCEPDFSAYSLAPNPKPAAQEGWHYRTGAGHIHLGWGKGFHHRSKSHMQVCGEIVKQLDFLIGLPSLLWDRNPLRRNLYGRAGAFRPKPYGLEYRVPSNRLFGNPAFVAFCFNQATKAYRDVIDDDMPLYDIFGSLAHDCINNNSLQWRDHLDLLEMVNPYDRHLCRIAD